MTSATAMDRGSSTGHYQRETPHPQEASSAACSGLPAARPPLRVFGRSLNAPVTMLGVQVMQSGTGLLANGLLIASIGSASFGTFSLGQAIALYVIGILDAGYLTPATIRAARLAPARAERSLLGQLPTYAVATGTLALVLLAVLPWLLPHFGVSSQIRLPVALSVVFAAVLLAFRESARMLGLSAHHWTALLSVEACANVAWLATLFALMRGYFAGLSDPAPAAIALYGIPGVGALAWMILRRARTRRLRPHLRMRALFERGRWSLAASQITWLQSQSYIYFVAGMLSAQTLGWVAAARMLFAPLQTLSTGLMRGVLPELARLAGSGQASAFTHRVRRVAFGMAAVCLAWTGLAVILALFFTATLQRHGYAITLPLVLAWAADFLFMLLRSVITQALRAMECFREISRQSAFGAAVSVALIPAGIVMGGAVGALLGLAGAELVAMLIGITTLRRRITGKEASS